MALVDQKVGVLKARGWSEDSQDHTVGCAACFMVFSHVDCFEAVPPSISRRWCAHFPRVIVSAHRLELVGHKTKPFSFCPGFCEAKQYFIQRSECSRLESRSKLVVQTIMRADQCMCHLQFDGVSGGGFHDLINAITVHTISLLSEARAPSWGGASELIKIWPQIYSAPCDKVFEENPEQTEALGRK